MNINQIPKSDLIVPQIEIQSNLDPDNIGDIKKISKSQKIKQRVKQLIINSTSHGLPHLLRSDILIIKIMWICFFLICFTLSIYFIVNNINQYLKYEVVTIIDLVYEYPIQFPTISLKFNTDNSIAYYSLENNIVNLIYSNVLLNKDIEKEFEQLNTTNHNGSIFYKFNSGKNMKNNLISFRNQTKIGELGGLDAEIFIGRPEEFTFPINSIRFHASYFSIYIHNNSINSFESMDEPIKLTPGFKTNIIINKVHTDRLGPPYNDCIDDLNELKTYDSLLVKYILTKTKSIYRQKDCLNLCKMQYVIENCNYSSIQIAFYWEIERKLDLLNISSDCYLNKVIEFEQIINIIPYCSRSCPLECDSYEYKIEYIYIASLFPSEIYAKTILMNDPKIKSKYPLDHNISLEDLRSSMVAFNVFYNNFQYTQIKQSPKKKFVDIISDFGGTFSLFVGLSFLSFGELIQIIYEIFSIYLTKID